MPKIFKVGGCVRDKFLGIKTKDIDFTFVLDDLNKTVEEGFKEMEQWMVDQGFTIFLSSPEMFTIRAKFPSNHKFAKLDADFVMARKEVGYVEGTRRPILELGTLEDDLVRRDFTVNAMAEDEDGNLIDLFDGMWALENKILLTPLDPAQTFLDDPLRMIRAIRFSITKDFVIAPKVWASIFLPTLIDKLEKTVSGERIREEVVKMMQADTVKTLRLFSEIDKIEPRFMEVVFSKGMWLKPTFEKK
jgi:tRNA nucleotidyltransferase/poly(A) polymerase